MTTSQAGPSPREIPLSGSVRRVAALAAALPLLAALALTATPVVWASTEGSGADGSSALNVGIAVVALILLSGVLLLTRAGK